MLVGESHWMSVVFVDKVYKDKTETILAFSSISSQQSAPALLIVDTSLTVWLIAVLRYTGFQVHNQSICPAEMFVTINHSSNKFDTSHTFLIDGGLFCLAQMIPRQTDKITPNFNFKENFRKPISIGNVHWLPAIERRN